MVTWPVTNGQESVPSPLHHTPTRACHPAGPQGRAATPLVTDGTSGPYTAPDTALRASAGERSVGERSSEGYTQVGPVTMAELVPLYPGSAGRRHTRGLCERRPLQSRLESNVGATGHPATWQHPGDQPVKCPCPSATRIRSWSV